MLHTPQDTEPVAAPTPACRLFSDFCLRLMEGATAGEQFEPAWNILRALFDASEVQHLRCVAASVQALGDEGPVHALDAQSAPEPLKHVFALARESHGLLAVVRLGQRRCDAVLVLRSVPFSQADRDWMELMLAHIRPALELGGHLASPLPTVASAVQLARLLPTPCALLDEAGRCMEQNAAFQRIVETIRGGVRDGRVVFDDHFLQDSWQQALLHADRTGTTQSLLAATPSGEQWKIHLVPFACVAGAVRPTRSPVLFALFEKYTRPGTSSASPSVLSTRPLTKAELEVLSNLLQGHSAKAIARARGASVNTVRSQIATILAKTGHRSQKELIALFNTG